MFSVLSSCFLFPHSGNPIIYEIIEIKYTKNLNNPLNHNVNLTKRASFASIGDNLCLCLLQQNQNADQIRIKFNRLLKKLSRGYYLIWGHALLAAAFVERWVKQE